MSGRGRGRAGGGGRKRRGAAHEEEHENHERWLVSYADMMTLLMVLFIVLFAISAVDQRKFNMFAGGLARSFGNDLVAINGGPAAATNSASEPLPFAPASSPKRISDAKLSAAVRAEDLRRADARRRLAEAEVARLERARAAMVTALKAKHLQNQVRFRYDERGLVVTLVTDAVMFPSGRAELRSGGRRILDAIAPVLQVLPNNVAVDGHTNSLPTNGHPYATNWELSTARATSVVRWLIEYDDLDPDRLTASGFADRRPLVPGAGPQALRMNRRVEVVVLSTLPAGDRALLPAVAP